jgi:hypothetical protein
MATYGHLQSFHPAQSSSRYAPLGGKYDRVAYHLSN